MVQNAAVRLLLNIPKYESVAKEIRRLHWLPVAHSIKFKSLCLAYKALNNTEPVFLKNLFSWYHPARQLRSTGARLMMVPRIKTSSWGGRSISYGTAKLWNTLPIDIGGASSLTSFRKGLKTWLIQN